MSAPSRNPFTPGAGNYPALLAGRSEEQQSLQAPVAAPAAKRPSVRDIVLMGPRGMGKTALLRWLEKKCKNKAVDCVLTNASGAETLEQIADEAIPRAKFAALIPEEFGANVGVAGASWRLKGREPVFQRALSKRCASQPLLLLLDEAHMVPPKTLFHLLNASQRVRGEGNPFMLVLAGTPHLRSSLHKAGASFWERAQKIHLGLLSRKESQKALIEPFGPALEIESAAVLESALEEAQDYPYFLQLMGSELWAADCQRIGQPSLAKALPRFEREKTDFYFERENELDEREARKAAAEVAALFRSKADPPYVGKARSAAGKKFGELTDLGFIVKRPQKGGGSICGPGIPSLMAHVLKGWECEHGPIQPKSNAVWP